jgi:EAL domain-containing protein (putative c-di-GMP-specific phosphodiesterase class I)
MAKIYGIRLLGIVEKPIVLARLNELIAVSNIEERKWRQQQPDAKKFTLDEILQGISADQFQPFFQPKVDLNSGKVTGAEALARWIHPEYGVVSPYSFIPDLEQSGNIDDLTFRMIVHSVSACRSIHEKGYTLSISINLSLSSLTDRALADRIIQIVRNAEVDPRYIVLEITESAAMTDTAHTLENLTRLCMHGFTLSIDDYGTGYSSMQQLTRVPFGELKIDQSFVKDFSENKAMRIVVESSIDMAHKLRIKSVAEGIETQQDWEILKSLGCNIGQGYFFAKPMELQKFYDFIVTYQYKSTLTSS